MECLLANEEISEQKIRELLEKFDLEEYAEYHPMILSGGQRQRLAICQAVMGGKIDETAGRRKIYYHSCDT